MARQQRERRREPRTGVTCPVAISGGQGRRETRGNTVNVANGGALITMPITALPDVGRRVDLTVSVPRCTPNTRMVEQIAAAATVVRHEPMLDDRLAGMAVRFEQEMNFAFEV